MILRRRAALNGVQLDELDERIYISSIEERPARMSMTATGSVNGNGQRLTGFRRESIEVSIRFRMNIRKNDMAGRAVLLERINGWAANGGVLTLAHRPDRQITVFLSQAPGGGEMYNWTDEFELLFTSLSVPYFEDALATSVSSGTATSGVMWLNVPGNTQTVVDVAVRNMSGATINSLTVSVGGKQMQITGTPIAAGRTIQWTHPNNGKNTYLRIHDGVRSLLGFRSGADDFLVSPGNNRVDFSASRAVIVTASVRGRYL